MSQGVHHNHSAYLACRRLLLLSKLSYKQLRYYIIRFRYGVVVLTQAACERGRVACTYRFSGRKDIYVLVGEVKLFSH